MRKLKRLGAAVAVGACLVLTGCPQVKSVQGEVRVKQGAKSWAGVSSKLVPVTRGMNLEVGETVQVEPGASVTISVKGVDGKACELTYTASFVVAEPVDCKKRQEENKQEQDEQPDRQQGSQEQTTAQDPPAQGSGSQATTQPDSNASAGSTASGSTGAPGGASTAADTAGTGLTALQTTLITIGSVVAGKAAYDKIKDDDKPVSR